MPYTSDTNKIGMRKERNGSYRCGNTSGTPGTQAAPNPLATNAVLPFDRINEDKFELPIPELKSETIYNLGGPRNGSDRVYTGYEMVEKDIPMDMQSAIWLMYTLGSCSTIGYGSYSVYKYNHTIAEANTLYHSVLHNESYGSSPVSTFDLFREYFGVLCKKIVIKIERGGKVSAVATVLIGKYGQTETTNNAATGIMNAMAINKQTSFPDPLNDATAKIYTYDMIDSSLSTFTYNGTAVDANFWNVIGSIEITIENTDLKIEQVMGDKFPYNVLIGARTYNVKITGYMPTTNQIQKLNNMELSNYAGLLAFNLFLSRDKTAQRSDYLQITFNSLFLKPFKDTMVNQTQKQKELDLELENATPYTDAASVAHTVGTCAVQALDKLNQYYYEDP
jgi:hypothetical protein